MTEVIRGDLVSAPALGRLETAAGGVLVLEDGEHPAEYVIPATAWDGARRGPLVYHGYEGKKSAPEFGVNLSRKNLEALERYRLEHMIADLSAEAAPAGGDKKERGESSWNC